MQRESIKAILGLIVIVCVISGLFAGIVPELNHSMWRWGIPAISLFVGLVCIVIWAKMDFKRDIVPDFLRHQTEKFFDRDGFCFAIVARVEDGVCVLHVMFQNRYEGPLQARLALRPGRELFLRAKIPIIGVDIDCPPAGFGIAKIPFSIPAKYQGKNQILEIGASREYPQGKGRILRFRPGMDISASANFANPFGTAMAVVSVASLAAGHIVFSKPARLQLKLPSGVREIPDELAMPTVVVLWKLGDPVPQQAAVKT